MNRLKEYYRRSIPFNHKPWTMLLITLGIVLFILAIFEPFNFRLNNPRQFRVLAGFALITITGFLLVFFAFPKLFIRFYNPDTWTAGKELLNYLLFLLVMTILVVGYDFFLVEIVRSDHYLLSYLFTDIIATFSVGIISITLTIAFSRNDTLKQHLKEAEELNKTLSRQITREKKEVEPIRLTGTTKESLTVLPDTILYMETSGNYVNVFYLEENTVQSRQIRTTIKQMDDSLKPFPMLIRSHRAFIVNVNKITTISGNALGYKLSIYGTPQEVPVSRSYIHSLKKALSGKTI